MESEEVLKTSTYVTACVSSDDVAEESAPFPQPVKSDAAITTLISAVDKNLRFI